MTLDLVNQASGSSSRTSTSQAQLDHDREVALAMQRTWDAETNTSPESIHTAKSLAPQETSGATSGAVKTTQPPMPAGRNSDVCSNHALISKQRLNPPSSLPIVCGMLRGYNNRRYVRCHCCMSIF